MAFSDGSDLWIYLVAPVAGALAVATVWRHTSPSMRPKTAKLFHDRRYPCAFSSDIPAMSPDAAIVGKRSRARRARAAPARTAR